MKEDKKIIGMFFILTLIGVVLLIARILVTGRGTYLFFIWNIFLCIVPLGLSLKIYSIYANNKKSKLIILLGIVWILVYPNAPYIITDFVHLSFIDFFSKGYLSYQPIKNIIIWYDLVLFCFFIITGFFMGLFSLFKIHEVFLEIFGKVRSFIFVFIIQLLASFAIYLGRFLRLNSWDIFNPVLLIKNIAASINIFSLYFTSLFTLFLFCIYMLFYTFAKKD